MNKILAGLGVLALLGLGVCAGNYLAKPTIDDLIERNNELAAQDSVRVVQLSNTQKAYEILAFDFKSEEELRENLKNVNRALSDNLEDRDATITTMASANTYLRDRLSSTSSVTRTEKTIEVVINDRNEYERGSIGVQGSIVIDEATSDSARTELDVLVTTSPVIVFSRNPDGTSQVTLDFGDMPIAVEELYGGNNINDPIDDLVRPEFWPTFGKITVSGAILGSIILLATIIF